MKPLSKMLPIIDKKEQQGCQETPRVRLRAKKAKEHA